MEELKTNYMDVIGYSMCALITEQYTSKDWQNYGNYRTNELELRLKLHSFSSKDFLDTEVPLRIGAPGGFPHCRTKVCVSGVHS